MTAIGWLVEEGQRPELLDRFRPIYAKTIAHHVTLESGASDAPLPPPATAEIVGEADDGKGARRGRATTSFVTTAGRR